jgi:hypothetical protein
VSENNLLGTDTLVGKFSANAASLFNRDGDQFLKLETRTEIVQAFGNLNLDGLVSDLATVIDHIDEQSLDEASRYARSKT